MSLPGGCFRGKEGVAGFYEVVPKWNQRRKGKRKNDFWFHFPRGVFLLSSYYINKEKREKWRTKRMF